MKRLSSLLLLPFLLSLAGCAPLGSYKLGSTLAESDRDVFFPPVLNESDEPRAATELRRALEREIRREGTLRIVPEREAATRLDVVTTEYEQDSIAYSGYDTDRPTQYRMNLSARVSFVRMARPGAGTTNATPIYVTPKVTGSENFSGGSDSVAAKRACLPKAAKSLAETIVENCANAW